MDSHQEQAGLVWQIGVWNRMSALYVREIDRRFAPVVQHVIARAQLTTGERVLPGRRPDRDVPGGRWAASVPEHHPVHRGTAELMGGSR